MEGHEEIVEFLLSRPGISRKVVNAKDDFGYTPLHLAVRYSHENVVRLLTTSSLVLPDRFLAATREPDDVGEHFGGYTPLHLAAGRGHLAIAKLLLRQPCQVEFTCDPINLHAVTWYGKTPLEVAQTLYAYSLSKGTFQDQNYWKLVQLLAFSDPHWLEQYRARTAMSANAIFVVSALVVAASFGCWLKPPGGISVPDSGAPSPSPSGVGSSRNSSLDSWNSKCFYSNVSFAFTFSMVTLMVGTAAILPRLELTSGDDMLRLQRAVQTAQSCLFVAVLFLLYCFSLAGSIVLHDLADKVTYYGVTWLPIIGFVCVAYFVGSSILRFRPDYDWKVRGLLLIFALSYVVNFAIIKIRHK